MTPLCGRTPAVSPVVPTAGDLYADALRGWRCRVVAPGRDPVELPTDRWTRDADHSDVRMLRRCPGPVLDVGCGPGRMTLALAERGVTALGIDVVEEAVRQTRARGGTALVRNVFDTVPAEGRWSSALLADGNIGIGGQPVRLLTRVRRLLNVDGIAVVELAEPGTGITEHRIQLEVDGRRSRPFTWTTVAPEALAGLAEAAAMRVLRIDTDAGRWWGELTAAGTGA